MSQKLDILRDDCTEKQCTKCKRILSLRDFHRNRATKTGYNSWCKTCKNARMRELRTNALTENFEGRRQRDREHCRKFYHTKKGRESSRRRYLNKAYGLSMEEYNQLFGNQAGKCAICGKHQTEVNHTLRIDHCHKTGEIRGLLCDHCNKGIGNFLDDIENLQCAIIYLNNTLKD